MAERELLNRTESHPPGDGVPGFYPGHPFPLPAAVQAGHFHAAGYEIAGFLPDLIKRALDAVINRIQQPRAQFDGKRHAGRDHRLADRQPGGVFIYLHKRRFTVQPDDFTDQLLVAHFYNVIHACAQHTFGDYRRAGDLFHASTDHFCSRKTNT